MSIDEMGQFTSYNLGQCGSVPDSQVFKHSHIWTHHHLYFRTDEYILVDKGTTTIYLYLVKHWLT